MSFPKPNHPAQTITPEQAVAAFKLTTVWSTDDHITATPIHTLPWDPPAWVVTHVFLDYVNQSTLTVYRMNYMDVYPGGFYLDTLLERQAI